MTASSEVRLVPVSREQRDAWVREADEWRALSRQMTSREVIRDYAIRAERLGVLVTAWDAVANRDTGELALRLARIATLLQSVPLDVLRLLGLAEALTLTQGEAHPQAFDEPAGGEAAAEPSLASRADAVWTVDDLPQLLDEPVERPSVSLRETIERVGERVYAAGDGPLGWGEPPAKGCQPGWFVSERALFQVEREAEEGERDE